ncbi:hypothetical protein BD309DRAFT_946235, partial [Dichomitus squalens]
MPQQGGHKVPLRVLAKLSRSHLISCGNDLTYAPCRATPHRETFRRTRSAHDRVDSSSAEPDICWERRGLGTSFKQRLVTPRKVPHRAAKCTKGVFL